MSYVLVCFGTGDWTPTQSDLSEFYQALGQILMRVYNTTNISFQPISLGTYSIGSSIHLEVTCQPGGVYRIGIQCLSETDKGVALRVVCLVSGAKSTATPPVSAFSGVSELIGSLPRTTVDVVKFDPNPDSNNLERQTSSDGRGGEESKDAMAQDESILGVCEPQQDYCMCGLIKSKERTHCCIECEPGKVTRHTPLCDLMNDGFGVQMVMIEAKGAKCRDCKMRPVNGKWGNCCSACKRGCHTNECSERIADSRLMSAYYSEYGKLKKKKSNVNSSSPLTTTLNEMLDSAGDVAEDFTELAALEEDLPSPSSLPPDLGDAVIKMMSGISILSGSIADVQEDIRKAILINAKNGPERSVGDGRSRHGKPLSAKQASRRLAGGKPNAGK
jgi:hypothetical protein